MFPKRVLRNTVKKILNAQIETPELIPEWKNVKNVKFSKLYRACWLVLITFALCTSIYHCGERIVYYMQEPVQVQSEINEQSYEDFPQMTLSTPPSEELLACQDKIQGLNTNATNLFDGVLAKGCSAPTMMFYFDNVTTIESLYTCTNISDKIKNITLQWGKNQFLNKFTVTDKFEIGHIETTIKNADHIPFQQGIKVKFNLDIQGLQLDVWIKFTFQANELLYYVDPNVKEKFIFYYKQHVFLNRKKFACDDKAAATCIDICKQKHIPANFSCQLPNLPKMSDNKCKADRMTCAYLEEFNRLIYLNPHKACHCKPECKKMRFAIHHDSTTPDKINFQLESLRNYIEVLREYFSYDFISLLCEIGGFLGFYTGISCISLFEVMTIFTYNRFLRMKKTTPLERTIFNQLRNRNETHSNTKYRITLIAKISLIFAVICYIIYDAHLRITLYFNYPVYVNIEIETDEYIQVPSFVYCSDSKKILLEKEKLMDKLNIPCINDIDSLLLLDQPEYENNSTSLWNDSIEFKYFDMFKQYVLSTSPETARRMGVASLYPTVFGNCAKYYFDKMEFHPQIKQRYFYFPDPLIGCNPIAKVFFMTEDSQIDYASNIFFSGNNQLAVTFPGKTYIRINRPTNPCTTLREFKVCRQNCFNELLKESSMNCSLPFVVSSDLPYCTTYTQAKQIKVILLQVYLNAFSYNICQCKPLCNQNIYIPYFDYDLKTFAPFIIHIRFQPESELRELYKEELSIPFVKLVCDIGTVISTFLGLSVLSFFNTVTEILQNFRRR